MVLDREIERGLTAVCWFCETRFVKALYCGICGFYRCQFCRKCACDLPDSIPAADVRAILMKTVLAMAGRSSGTLEVCPGCNRTAQQILETHWSIHGRRT